MSDNVHEVPEQYTEMACLLGFVRRYLERVQATSDELALVAAAQAGDPSAIQHVTTVILRAIAAAD